MDTMLHIWRNSPLGRENLLQSVHFCRMVGGMALAVYRPLNRQSLMYFENSVVTIELDHSYLVHGETSETHLRALLDESGVPWHTIEPVQFSASTLPNLPVDWAMMSCPRTISQPSSRIGLTHIGPKVRAIVSHATFPVFIPSSCYKEWKRVTVFFGGSPCGLGVVAAGMRIADLARVPLTILTQLDGRHSREELRAMLRQTSFPVDGKTVDRQWIVFDSGSLEENLYAVAFDSLVVVGATGDRSLRGLLFGGRTETIQSTLPNPLVIVGPECKSLPWGSTGFEIDDRSVRRSATAAA